ncbi:hypothetical protein AMK59_1126, partial [Oryctes borbonicus]
MTYYRPTFSQAIAMSRGRGYSSSRGSSYRGSSSRGSWGSSRGGYSPSRGSGGPGRFSSSFGSSFDNRNKYGGSSDRYPGRGSDDYRKSYRPDASGYSGRDHRSPDRKRVRTESLSSRHDGGFGGSSDSYGGRYESSGSYPERRSFSSDRRSSSFSSRREEFRKPLPPPPSSPRGGYRGRISSRGSLRPRLRERPTRRRLIESSYVLRRRNIRSSDYVRRLKMAKFRSAIARRSMKKSKSLEKEESEEEKDEEVKKDKTEKDVETDAKESTNEEEKEKASSTPKKIKKESSVEREDKKSDSGSDDKSRKRPYIKLICPHCQTRSPTFARYSMHLQSGKHMAAMRRIAIKQKAILSRMRVIQRNAQRELEKTTEDLAPRTNFCPLCKLNYKQPKATHQASEAHKNMKKFLMPYCKVCKITFKSPMLYESHCCLIDHLKRKAIAEDKSDKEDGSGLEDNLENFMTIDSVGEMEDEETTTEKKKEEVDTKPKEQINVGIENIKKVEVYYCDLCRMYLPRGEDCEISRILAKHCKQRTHLQRYVRYKEDKELTKRAERLQRKETAEKEKEKEKEDAKGDDEQEDKKPESCKENGDVAIAEEDDAGDEKLWADVDKDLGDILAEAGSGNKSSDEDEEDSAAAGERFDRFKLSEKEKKAEEKKLIAEASEKETVEIK